MKTWTKHILSGLVGAMIAFVIFFCWGFCHTESYCFFSPWIDTQCAEGFSDEQFQKITNGMNRAEVDSLMCTAPGIGTNRNGTVTYGYTSDGKCSFGDFAWFGRSLIFSNDVVVSITSCMYYD